MRTRFSIVALGLACIASVAVAQTGGTVRGMPATSDKRIAISKGEVALAPRVDTVFVTRYDTVVVTRTDSIRVPFQIVRHDTVVLQAAAPLPVPSVNGPFYLGVFAGATVPTGNIDRLYSTGMHAGGVLGYENRDRILGLRITGALAQLSRHNGIPSTVVGTQTPLLMTWSADLKVIPLTFEKVRFYGLAGTTLNSYRDVATVAAANTGVTNVEPKGGWYMPSKTSWTTKHGYHVGGGADFTMAGQELFLEARAATVHANGAHSWFVPLSMGFRFF